VPPPSRAPGGEGVHRAARGCVECVVCMDPSPESRGLRCGGGEGGEGGGAESHFTCAGCVDQQTRITAEGMGVRMGVPCCGFRCGALYDEQALAVQCTPAVYVLYSQAKVQYVQAATERAVEQRNAAERLRLAALSEADRQALAVRKHITEEILTLKCPSCGKAFLDFDACFALTCIDRYVCMYVCMLVCMLVCMYGCMYVCVYVCMYLCMYVYVCILTPSFYTYLQFGPRVRLCLLRLLLHPLRRRRTPARNPMPTQHQPRQGSLRPCRELRAGTAGAPAAPAA
jgi:hypothetical protein